MRRRDVYEIWSADKSQVYVGLSVNSKKRLKQHRYKGPVVELLKSGGTMVVKDFQLPQEEAVKKEKELVKFYKSKRNIRCLNKATAGALGSSGGVIWTESVVRELAKGCKNRAALYYKNGSAYHAARRDGYLDDLFPKPKIEIVQYDITTLKLTDILSNLQIFEELIGKSFYNHNVKDLKSYEKLVLDIKNSTPRKKYEIEVDVFPDEIEEIPYGLHYIREIPKDWTTMSIELGCSVRNDLIFELVDRGFLPEPYAWFRREPLYKAKGMVELIRLIFEKLRELDKLHIVGSGYDSLSVRSILMSEFINAHVLDTAR